MDSHRAERGLGGAGYPGGLFNSEFPSLHLCFFRDFMGCTRLIRIFVFLPFADAIMNSYLRCKYIDHMYIYPYTSPSFFPISATYS